MILYIAGPMTGLPDNNYPAVHAAAAALRAAGHTVLNPAENPPPPEGYTGNVWQYYMRLSLKQIADAEGVVMLHGWTKSKGAEVEINLADGLGLQVWLQVPYYDRWQWFPHTGTSRWLSAECPAP